MEIKIDDSDLARLLYSKELRILMLEKALKAQAELIEKLQATKPCPASDNGEA